MDEKAAWVLAGIVVGFGILALLILISTWIEDCGRKVRMRLVEEFSKKMTEAEEESEEHTRQCLAEQKEQIETAERKAREFQAARFAEERESISKEWYDKGVADGTDKVLKWIKEEKQAGRIIFRKEGELTDK